jgi:5'-nucleotidase
MLNILLSNDDGVLAPGLRILRDELAKIGHVTVIAPETESSGMSSCLSLNQALRITQIEEHFYSLRGTPADCVHAALTGLIDFIPDIVISGINNRSNLGDDIIYSGTFAAAFEGRMLNYPALSISMVSNSSHPRFETGARVCRELVDRIHSETYFKSGVLNVNIPDVEYSRLKGVKITHFGHRPLSHPIQHGIDPRGYPYFWLGSRADVDNLDDPHTDFYATHHGYVSITPVNLNMTHSEIIPDLIELFTDREH